MEQNNIRYCAKVMTLGKNPEIDLSQEEYQNIKLAKTCLSELFSFEEKYELLLSNYLELEQECLSISSESMINRNHGYREFYEIQSLFNQRVVNLLTTSRLYLDQIEQHIKFCNKDLEVKKLFSEEYDNNFEYRFMEALRNYVQHRGLAIHSSTLYSGWIGSDDEKEMEFNTFIFTNKLEVSKDKAFKKAVAEEMPDKVNIIFSARSYVESLSKVHCELRDKLSKIADEKRKTIKDLIDKYETLNDGKSLGLSIIQVKHNGEYEEVAEEVHITLEWENIRLELIKKNQSLVNLSKRFVSSSMKNKHK